MIIDGTWPAEPYKGLSYYNSEDVLLFAGRDNDIDQCVGLLAQSSTRTLILQGRTACGKSSFLRAGLIPALESRGYGFIFLRRDKDEYPVLIRCTSDPIARLAEELFRFTSRSWRIATALGAKDIGLLQMRRGHDKITKFVDACRNPYTLLGILQDIAKEFSHTLVIVLDQAEEVITLARPSEEGPKDFFDFLKLFNASNLNVKLVVSLRTERFGEFFRFLQFDASAITDVKQYLLENLDRSEVQRAIELPTLRKVAGVKKAPFEVYGFEYEPGLIDKIVNDLFATDPSGGILPVMQVVCRDLYNEVRHLSTPRRITARLYELGGGVSGRVDKHIGQSLQAAFDAYGRTQSTWEEERRWRTGLSKLANAGPDGTVSTDVKTEDSLKRILQEAGVTAPIASVLDYLAQTDVLVLRRVWATSPVDGSPSLLYSLGHDAIALALHRWTLRDQEEAKAAGVRQRFKIAAGVGGLLALICGIAIGYILVQSDRAIVREAEVLRAFAERVFRDEPGIAAAATINSITKLESRKFMAPKGSPMLTLANIISTLPHNIVAGSDDASSRAFAFPASKKFLFWSSDNGLTIVSWDGSQRKTISIADLTRGRISGRVTLANAEELGGDAFLVRIASNSSVISLIRNDEVVEVYDTEFFMNISQKVKSQLAKLKENSQSTSPQSTLRSVKLAVVRKMVFLYILTASDAYIETFALDDSQGKFSVGGWLEDKGAEGTIGYWVNMLSPGIAILYTFSSSSVSPSEGERGRFLSNVSAFDVSTGENRSLWSFASIDSVKDCLNRNIEGSQRCLIVADDHVTGVVAVYVPPKSRQMKPNEIREQLSDPAKLVFLDVRTGSANQINANAIIQSSHQAVLGPESRWPPLRPDEYFDNLSVGGSAESPVFAVHNGEVYDVFKLKDKEPIYIGTYTHSTPLRGELFFSDDRNLMVEMSALRARIWNISEPAGGQVEALAKLGFRELVKKACGASLPQVVTRMTKEQWSDLTGLTDGPPPDPCN